MSNLFNDGEPINAVEVSEQPKSRKTNKPRKTASKRRSTASKSTEVNTPSNPVVVAMGDQEDVENVSTVNLFFKLNSKDQILVSTGKNQRTHRTVQHYGAEIDAVGVVLNPGDRALVPVSTSVSVPAGYGVRIISSRFGAVNPSVSVVDVPTDAATQYAARGIIPIVNNTQSRVFIGHGEPAAHLELVKIVQFDVKQQSKLS